jgi:signal transduction histidine kinase/ligand-binding sensor domain-containing protein
MISRAGHTLLLIIIILIAADLKAQSFSRSYHFKHLNVQNGLTQNIVYHFLQDSRGYIWIGTHNGLSLYDGIKTTNFLHDDQNSKSIARNFISGIAEDSVQRVWVSNENGIELYNRTDNSFTHFGVDRPDGAKDYTYCQLLGFVSADELWFLETKKRTINSLNTKTHKTSFISELDADNALLYKGSFQTIHIWSSYNKGTIHQVYKNKELIEQQTYFSGKDGLVSKPELVVSHVLQQNDSIVWLSTDEGLVKLNPILNQYHIYNKWQKQKVTEVRYATLSSQGQLWVATGSNGVYTFDIKTNQFIYNFRNNKLDPFSICSDNIVSLYFDKVGNVWCGSYGNGSSYANTENIFFANYLSKDETQAWNANNNILWVGADANKSLWCIFSNASGFWVLDKEFKIKIHKTPLLENGTPFNGYLNKLLFDNHNNIWCGTNKGLYKYTIATNTMHPVKYELISDEVQGSGWIKGMIWLHDSSIVFSTYAGLYRVTNVSGDPVVKPITFLPPGAYIGFETLFQDKNNFIYIKSINDSLFILKPVDNGKKFALLKSLHLMPDVNYYFSKKNDSLIYIATNYGLYHINNNNFHLEKETCDNKLSFIDIRSVFKKDNNLWIFGEKGLYLFDEKSRQGRTYTIEDGLPSNEFSFSSLVFNPDEKCVAGTASGLVSFYPNRLQGSIYPPGAQLTGIYINDILHATTPNSNEIKKIGLSFKENTFSFDFSTIAFHHITDCSFEYKLDGYDEDWIKSGNAHYTRYSKIPPGNYVFNVRVIDPLGKASPFTKTLEIQIAKAYWQTNLFRAGVLAVILLIGWLLSRWYFRYRIRKQKMEFEKQQLIEKERTRIATDMHDDLGAGLSRIRFLSQSILNKKINDEAVRTELKKITSFSDEMSEKMGEIVWALNEKNDTLADLIAYTRSYTVEYLANHNIECEANTPLNLPGTFITGEMRRNIFLSVKECLHNIVKHAGATKVCFSVELEKMIRIIIHDNGRGIDWNNRRAFSNGLENISRRMKEINGDVNFVNEQGTKVIFTIPFVL